MSSGQEGHSSILKNISGSWTLYCNYCDYKKNWPVPLGDVVVENGNLVNHHPLGKVILFDGHEVTFFTGKKQSLDHCELKRNGVCGRCRRNCGTRFCKRCLPFTGGAATLLPANNDKWCIWCNLEKKNGVCTSCVTSPPKLNNDAMMVSF